MFPDCNSLNSHTAMKWCTKLDVVQKRCPIVSQGHPSHFKVTQLKKVVDPNWAFPDCNSSFNSMMAMKWCTNHEAAWKRCPIVFQGHPSNFKVTQNKALPILTWIERFRTPVTPVWIHQWLWNNAKSLTWYGRCALLFIKVIGQISMSHGTKNRRFWPKLIISGL